jgi:parallel beta-helix repeat protein
MILSLLLSTPLLAVPQTTVYVPDDYAIIQDAIVAVASGDTVIVRPGTYLETEIAFMGKSIHLLAERGPAETVIDGSAAGSVFVFNAGEGPDAILEGFTITNGKKWDGGGIAIFDDLGTLPASPTVRNCVIENNEGSGGGGGIQIAGGSTATIDNCLIQDNFTSAYDGAGVVIFNSQPLFKNCTIRNNTATRNGGGFSLWDTSTILTTRNCIMTGNLPNNVAVTSGAPAIRVRYSLSQGDGAETWFGTGCIDDDPLYTTGPLGDAYLSQMAAGQIADSPCLNTGKDTVAPYWTTRTDHAWDGNVVDMGYHYRDPDGVELSTTGAPGGLMTFDVINGTQAGPLVYLYAAGTGSYQATNPYTGNIVVSGLASAFLTVGGFGAGGPNGEYSFPANVPANAAGLIYVQVLDGYTDRTSNVVGI